jgi:hypothetical protein
LRQIDRFAVVAIGALTLLTAACTGPSAGPASSSATPSMSTPSSTPTSTAPSPSELPSPSPAPSATSPAPAATIPADWKSIPPKQAGVEVDSVDEVVGAWKLKDGSVTSIVRYGNDQGITDPEALYTAYFDGADAAGDVVLTHTSETLASGKPMLVVTSLPAEDAVGGEAQTFYYVLSPAEITSGVVNASPAHLRRASAALAEIMRAE